MIQEATPDNKEKSRPISRLNEVEMKKLQATLQTVLLIEKPYLDEELTLGKLAQMVSTTDKKLSNLLNQHSMNRIFRHLWN